MKPLCTFLFFLPLVLATHVRLYAQDTTAITGELDAGVDTALFYRKLYEYSRDRKLLYFLYRTVFNPPVKTVKVNKKRRRVPEVPVRKYRGKVIRHIEVMSLDPFGTSISDTTRKPHSVVQKAGNTLHVRSGRKTILNYLLFRENDRIDPLKLEESERLLRGTEFIRDARITVQPVTGTRDSFDIFVLTQDYWSIKPDVTVTSSRIRYRLTETNMLGWGHVFDNRITDKLKESSPLILDGSYRVPTIGNTYISPSLFYGTSPENNIRGVSVNRPFYSPITRVAGGMEVLSRSMEDSVDINDTIYGYSYRSFVTDGWLGYSWAVRKGETDEERSTRFISALRYSRIRYPELNPANSDLRTYFSRSDFYLGSLSLSSRKYRKERYIFRFGETEDVPEGNKLTWTSGIEDRVDGTRYYLGIDGAIGRYFNKAGYVYLGMGYSTFLKPGRLYKGEITSNLIYFSPLSKLGRWRARQFVSCHFIYGIHRDEYEKIYLNGDIGMPGYKEDLPYGTSRMLLTSQTVLYTPYEFLGFRFAPVIIFGFGLVGDYDRSVFKSRLYQVYGAGILVKNELLVLNTFQVTLALYPVLPGGGSDARFNPVKLSQSRFEDFDITRPGITPFK